MTLNKAMLIGNLGRDPEIRYTKSGDAVANFSLATSENWKDKQGNRQERTEWHNVVAFGRLADLAQNYLKKGKKIYVEGRIQTRDWMDAQNVKHYRTEVVANTIQFLDRAPEGEGRSGGRQNYGGDQQGGGQQQQQGDPGPDPGAYVEDDIPF